MSINSIELSLVFANAQIDDGLPETSRNLLQPDRVASLATGISWVIDELQDPNKDSNYLVGMCEVLDSTGCPHASADHPNCGEQIANEVDGTVGTWGQHSREHELIGGFGSLAQTEGAKFEIIPSAECSNKKLGVVVVEAAGIIVTLRHGSYGFGGQKHQTRMAETQALVEVHNDYMHLPFHFTMGDPNEGYRAPLISNNGLKILQRAGFKSIHDEGRRKLKPRPCTLNVDSKIDNMHLKPWEHATIRVLRPCVDDIMFRGDNIEFIQKRITTVRSDHKVIGAKFRCNY